MVSNYKYFRSQQFNVSNINFFFINLGHDKNSLYGRGKSWERLDIERLIHQLIFEGYLFEKMTATRDNIVVAYVKVGPKAFELLTGDIKVIF